MIQKIFKLMVIALVAYAVPTALLYLAFAYGNWNMNPANWPDPSRGFHIGASLIVGSIIAAFACTVQWDEWEIKRICSRD